MGCIRLATWIALPVAAALLLCAAPEAARAGACQKAGLTGGCVESKDIAPESLRAVDFKNQSQGFFALGASQFQIPDKSKIYVELELTPPADGFLIVTGSTSVIAGLANDPVANGSVACELKIGRPSARVKRLKRISVGFDGSADKKSKAFDSIASTAVTEVKGGKARKVAMACKPRDGAVMNIDRPALTVVFHPIAY